ncbi:hypothetical protein BT63DRAFT_482846 [Microthyrium microscopicum]|uniref:alpha-glucosidase n=1 Tax=Microthyrium microscopicum TaxID=703497 RepID=A0A6A6U1X2_9PEZI|nr:hypothetical protein BT63DRAFT_482846 [Microthyrium microscopicum]
MATLLTDWIGPLIQRELLKTWQKLSTKATESAATEVSFTSWLPTELDSSSSPIYQVQPRLDRHRKTLTLIIRFGSEPESLQVREIYSFHHTKHRNYFSVSDGTTHVQAYVSKSGQEDLKTKHYKVKNLHIGNIIRLKVITVQFSLKQNPSEPSHIDPLFILQDFDSVVDQQPHVGNPKPIGLVSAIQELSERWAQFEHLNPIPRPRAILPLTPRPSSPLQVELLETIASDTAGEPDNPHKELAFAAHSALAAFQARQGLPEQAMAYPPKLSSNALDNWAHITKPSCHTAQTSPDQEQILESLTSWKKPPHGLRDVFLPGAIREQLYQDQETMQLEAARISKHSSKSHTDTDSDGDSTQESGHSDSDDGLPESSNTRNSKVDAVKDQDDDEDEDDEVLTQWTPSPTPVKPRPLHQHPEMKLPSDTDDGYSQVPSPVQVSPDSTAGGQPTNRTNKSANNLASRPKSLNTTSKNTDFVGFSMKKRPSPIPSTPSASRREFASPQSITQTLSDESNTSARNTVIPSTIEPSVRGRNNEVQSRHLKRPNEEQVDGPPKRSKITSVLKAPPKFDSTQERPTRRQPMQETDNRTLNHLKEQVKSRRASEPPSSRILATQASVASTPQGPMSAATFWSTPRAEREQMKPKATAPPRRISEYRPDNGPSPTQALSPSEVLREFRTTYPEYTGNLTQFTNTCVQMQKAKVAKYAWDDFIVRSFTEYRPYAAECTDNMEEPMTIAQFYADSDELKYARGVITKESLMAVYAIFHSMAGINEDMNYKSIGNTPKVSVIVYLQRRTASVANLLIETVLSTNDTAGNPGCLLTATYSNHGTLMYLSLIGDFRKYLAGSYCKLRIKLQRFEKAQYDHQLILASTSQPSSLSALQSVFELGTSSMAQYEVVPQDYELTSASESLLELESKSEGITIKFTFEAVRPSIFRTTFTTNKHTLPPHRSAKPLSTNLANIQPRLTQTSSSATITLPNTTASLDWTHTPILTIQDTKTKHIYHADLPHRSYALDGPGIAHYTTYRLGDLHAGLGEKAAPLDLSNRAFVLSATDSFGYDAYRTDPLYKHIPLLLTASADGVVGLFSTSHARGFYSIGSEMDGLWGRYKVYRQAHGGLEEYIIIGKTLSEVVTSYAEIVGYPKLVPRWAFGYIAGGMKYSMLDDPPAHEAVLDFADLLSEYDIPCSGFQLSSGYTVAETEPKTRNVFTWNGRRFPDPKGFVGEMREAGVRIIANVKPYVLRNHPEYERLEREGALFKMGRETAVARLWSAGGGESGEGSHVNFTSKAGFQWWYEGVKKLREVGIEVIWNDNNEYTIPNDGWECKLDNPAVEANGDESTRKDVGFWGRAIQTELMGKASHDALVDMDPNIRPFVLTRSATPGTMRYAASSWSGDNYTRWSSMQGANAITINAGLCLLQCYGHDCGGFEGPQPSPELLLRWIQYAVHSPRLAINCFKTSPKDNNVGDVIEPWMYPRITPLVRRAMKRRYELIPYTYSLHLQSHQFATPIQRWIGWGFEHDPEVWTEELKKGDNQYWFGDALLIGGVYQEGQTISDVYLPKSRPGSEARDYINLNAPFQEFQEGHWVTIKCDWKDSIPILARIGSAIPVGRPYQTLSPGEKTNPGHLAPDNYRGVEIFPPKQWAWDASPSDYVWYEDDGMAANPNIAEFRLAYGPSGVAEQDNLVVKLDIKANGFKPAWSELAIILPVGDQRDVFHNDKLAESYIHTDLSGNKKRAFKIPMS